MPLLIPTEELEPGMRLYESLVARGAVMLQGGRELGPDDIQVIQRRFPGMCIRVSDPVLDSLIEFEDDSRERQVAVIAQERVTRCMAEVQERFANRASPRGLDFGALQATVVELMEYLALNPISAALVHECFDSRNYLGHHTGNVFYLSMLLGASVREYVAAERKRQTAARDFRMDFAQDLTALGLGAMVMDLGMTALQGVLANERPLTPQDSAAIRAHPNVGAEMLPETFNSVARTVVRQHHENMTGTGYPRGLAADKIHVFARIVRIADAYDAGTSVRVFRQARSPARVLWEMTHGPHWSLYDPVLLQAFAKLIQPFPVGSKLRLQDGRYAAVVEYNRKDPFDPRVVIAFDGQGQPLPPDRLEGPCELSARGLRLRSFRGEDVSFIYTRANQVQFDANREFGSAFQTIYP